MTNFKETVLKEYKHKIELHAHTTPASLCSEINPSELVATYRSENYSGLVLTNHFYPWQSKTGLGFKKYIDEHLTDFEKVKTLGNAANMKIYLGIELNFEENANDYLVYGIDEDFIRHGISRKMKTLEDFVSSVDRRDILIIQAHPFRKNMTLAPENLVDGIEVFNLHPNHNSRVGYASRYAEDLSRCVCTCGTDFHHRGQACLTALLAREMPENEKALAKLIREEPIYKAGNAIITF